MAKKIVKRTAPVAPSARVAPTTARVAPRGAVMAQAQSRGPAAVLAALKAGQAVPAAPKGLGSRPGAPPAPKGPQGPDMSAQLKASEAARILAEKETAKLKAQIESMTASVSEARVLSAVIDPDAQAPLSVVAAARLTEDPADWAVGWIGCLASYATYTIRGQRAEPENGTSNVGLVSLPHPDRASRKNRAEAQGARDQGWIAIWPAEQIVAATETSPAGVEGDPLYVSQENWDRICLADPPPAYLTDAAPELLT